MDTGNAHNAHAAVDDFQYSPGLCQEAGRSFDPASPALGLAPWAESVEGTLGIMK